MCEVTLFSYVQALTERQPQLEKKPMRGKAPLSRKVVVALCVASFVVGMLFSGGKVSLTPESGSRDGAKEEGTRASGCENERVKVCVYCVHISRTYSVVAEQSRWHAYPCSSGPTLFNLSRRSSERTMRGVS
jgi:hypothetical protein